MKTNLAYIDDSVAPALLGAKTRSAFKVVGGFEIPDSTESDKRVENFSSAAARLKESLANIGVTPLAVLPSEWWHKMAADAGLVTLKSDKSMVYFRGELLMRENPNMRLDPVYTKTVAQVAALGAVALPAATFAALSYYGFGQADSFLLSLPAIVGGGVGGAIAEGVTGFFSERRISRMIRKAVREIMTGKNLSRYLSDDRYWDGKGATTLSYPKPTPDAAEVIGKLAAAKVEFHVSSEPQALSFNPPLEKIVRRALADEQAEAEEMRRRVAADPIIFVETAGVVAIVAQYGDFPLEKELVDRVMSTATI